MRVSDRSLRAALRDMSLSLITKWLTAWTVMTYCTYDKSDSYKNNPANVPRKEGVIINYLKISRAGPQ